VPPRDDRASIPAATSGVAATPKGRLVVHSTPEGASVSVDGRRLGATPFTLDDINPGSHLVQVTSSGATVTHTVAITAGTTASLLVPMAETGFLEVRGAVDFRILENGTVLGNTADGALSLSPGVHRLELRNDALDLTSEAVVTIVPGQMARFSPILPEGLLQVNALPWAHVWVDGREVGDTPLGNLRVPLGTHEVRFQHPQLGEQVRQVVVTATATARVSVDLR
jgi:hypothetical protein